MPSTEEREAQPVLAEPCPKCGTSVVLRFWKGRFFTKCQNTGCSFGYDADNRGNPASRCSVCGAGRMRTLDNMVRICTDCGANESPKAAAERPNAEPARPAGLGLCPKCKKGKLAVHSGSYGTFVSCSERCGMTYTSDAQGLPEAGTCKACQGPVKKTQKGSMVCAVCGSWQDAKKTVSTGAEVRPAKPKAAQCPRCSQPLKEVFTKRQKWAYRCEPCKAWYDA
jgi:ssDNA-binding Zn-finger/Zn-ribbon topoisomerase 1